MTAADRYVPAAGRTWLTGVYDMGVALTMREPLWRPVLTEEAVADLPDGGVIVDVGAGTGTQSLALAARRRDARVIAVDGDPAVLDRARVKPGADTVEWTHGKGTSLPVADASVDRVTCSLMLHHLTSDAKLTALRESHRILVPGGRLHVADWGAPTDRTMSAAFTLLELLDGKPTTADHRAGRLPGLIEQAGFTELRVTSRVRTVWGSLELLTAKR